MVKTDCGGKEIEKGLLGVIEPGEVDLGPEYARERQFLLALLKVAVIAKFGGTPIEAAESFLKEVEVILAKNGLKDAAEPTESTLRERLDALRSDVGEADYRTLLSNPDVERIAARAYRKQSDRIVSKTFTDIAGVINNAMDESELAMAMSIMYETPGSHAETLANA